MAGQPWGKWYWADWRSEPTLRICSMAARGFWMELLCIAAEADPTGYVLVNGRVPTTTDLARMTGAPEADIECWLAELERNGTYSRDRKGRIYSRRMVRDAKRRKIAQQNGKFGGNPTLSKQTTIPPSDNPRDKAEDNTQKPEARNQKEDLSLDDEFAAWYAAYPRRVARGQALKAYRVARKLANAATLLEGAKRYARQRSCEDPKFTRHPATWLSGQCWADEFTSSGADPRAYTADWPLEKWARIVARYEHDGTWHDEWGPPPGQPGSLVPQQAA